MRGMATDSDRPPYCSGTTISWTCASASSRSTRPAACADTTTSSAISPLGSGWLYSWNSAPMTAVRLARSRATAAASLRLSSTW